MHFWLCINDSVLCFRLSNIFFYSIGTLGLIMTVRYIVKSYAGVITAVVIQFCFSAMLYYNQICGEYVLVLAVLYWLIYFSVKMIYEQKLVYFILWDLTAVLAIYSQYGAMFTIIGTGFVASIIFLKNKDFKSIRYLLGIGMASVIMFIAPLYLLFTRKQMSGQGITEGNLNIREICHGIIDAFEFLVFSWHTNFKENILKILIISIILLAIIGLIRICFMTDKKKALKNVEKQIVIISFAIIVMITYTIGVATGKYAYGLYASRHTILVLPMLITLFGCIFGTEITYCIDKLKDKRIKISGLIITAIMVILSLNSIHYVWYEHWNYDQIDTALEVVNEIYDMPVWVSSMAVPTTIVYGEKSFEDKYDEYINWIMNGECVKYDNIILSSTNDIESDFDDQLPNQCIVIYTDNTFDVADVLETNGYTKEVLQEGIESAMALGTYVVKYSKQ
jgi:hypothetical protein